MWIVTLLSLLLALAAFALARRAGSRRARSRVPATPPPAPEGSAGRAPRAPEKRASPAGTIVPSESPASNGDKRRPGDAATHATLPLGDEAAAGPPRRPMTWDEVAPRLRERLTDRIAGLSTLPTAMNDLIGVLQNEDADPAEVARIASTDPAVVAEILRIVNSAFFGLQAKVSDLHRAILLLGYNRVKFVVLRLAIEGDLARGADPGRTKRLRSVWRHSYLVSEAVSLLIRRHGGVRAPEAATAALLHDAGKLLLVELPPRDDLDSGSVFRGVPLTMEQRIFLEEDYFGVNHCLIGERIGAKLSLPPVVRIIQALHHHDLDGSEVSALAGTPVSMLALVKLADILAHDLQARLRTESGLATPLRQEPPRMEVYRKSCPRLPDYDDLVESFTAPLRRSASFIESLLPSSEEGTGEARSSRETGDAEAATACNEIVSVPAATADGPPPIEIAGRYRLLTKLGEGSVGSVYQCQDTLVGQRFAIKILKPELRRSARAFASFVEEMRSAMKLNHPNIVRVLHLDERDGVCFVLQELVSGRSLEEILADAPEGRFDESRVLPIASELAAALGYAHDRGVIHRDVKPSNVMVDAAGSARLLDFGVAACRAADAAQAPPEVAGTPGYMSPESWDGKVDRRSDIYAFGVLLYRLLAGRMPLDTRTPGKAPRTELPSRPAPLPSVSDAIMALVLRCLEPEPSRRWQDFHEVSARLEAIGKRPPLPRETARRAAGAPAAMPH